MGAEAPKHRLLKPVYQYYIGIMRIEFNVQRWRLIQRMISSGTSEHSKHTVSFLLLVMLFAHDEARHTFEDGIEDE